MTKERDPLKQIKNFTAAGRVNYRRVLMFIPSVFGGNFVDNFFDDIDNRNKNARYTPQTGSFMKTDIKESEDNYEIEIELPGFDKNDVKAQLNNGYLIISAEKTENNDVKDNKKYIRKERYTGSCSRSFYVGDALTQNDIKAKFDKGVLTLMVPKHVEKPVEENKFISIV